MQKLVKYLKNYKKEVIWGPVFKLIEAILELIVPLIMANIIDIGIKGEDSDYVWRMGALMIVLAAVGLTCALICQFFAAKASQGFGTDLRNKLFAHINSLSYAEIDKLGTPSLVTRITNDVNQLQVAVAMLIRLVIRAPFLVIGATVMAMIIDLQMSLIFIAAAAGIAVVLYLVMSRSVPFYNTIQKLLDRISLVTRENLSGARVIRAFSKQKKERKRFEDTSNEQKDAAIRMGKISALLNPLTYLIVNLGIVAIIWFGGGAVNTGHLEQGEIVALVNYMTQILLALIVVANLVIIFTRAAASAARVNEVLDTHSVLSDAGNEENIRKEHADAPKIEFERVSFQYGDNGGESALRDVSVRIYTGQTIGVIGGTGSGKSTFVNLIPRFYDATRGKVFVDGTNVRDYTFSQLRKDVGIVPQRAVLFAGSIRDNMRWRDESATDGQIIEALKVAQAWEFVKKLPQQLDTQILQGGQNLSGGQKQRLTIARALVGDPQILILDDSASALDFATDAALRKAIRQFGKGITVIMVSQRATTVKNADKIIVFDEGEVAGIGTHDELFETNDVYREICLSQLERSEVVG
ncbi:MAG: ABC transporter ATP-binding protein [Christensenella sp.]|uniref:ABC transporter ATP-binding protein n=1 Tax=Christensenella sp. TaxID=1935934 RepID=UPI002B1F986A|nr:ABC transporter ATP-binding protein [Christensenella sp.]MEA5004213.1 ABC transporter ATP-binding protein [Christensenella sp.]